MLAHTLCSAALVEFFSKNIDFSLWNKQCIVLHSGPENLKKSRQKNSWNQINQFHERIHIFSWNSNNFFSWNCTFGSFNLFPSSKIDFWPFLQLQTMEFGQKFISWNWFILFHGFFCPSVKYLHAYYEIKIHILWPKIVSKTKFKQIFIQFLKNMSFFKKME